MHYLSKLTALLWQPLTWVAVLLVAGTVLLFLRPERYRARGRWFCALAAVFLLALGWQPLPEAFIRALEEKHSAPRGDLSRFTGMVVLGGVFGGDDGRDHGQIALGSAGERVVLPVPLMSQYPGMKLLFTGGSAALFGPRQAEAEVAQVYFERMGTDMARTRFEARSRNTYENAIFSREVEGIDPQAAWLLVTSASHMPRAFATFQKAGWNVTPYPVDFYSQHEIDWLSYSLFGGVEAWQLAIREYLGLAVYKLAGRA